MIVILNTLGGHTASANLKPGMIPSPSVSRLALNKVTLAEWDKQYVAVSLPVDEAQCYMHLVV